MIRGKARRVPTLGRVHWNPMRLPARRLTLAFIMATASVFVSLGAETLTMPHPDAPSRSLEYFVEKPAGAGPWPAVVFIHGHQEGSRPGGRDFVTWGVLDEYARRGYLAVAVSQPGYGGSTGPPDFCGPFTQHAVSAVISSLRSEGYIAPHKLILEGISRGALVAALIAAREPGIDGIVLISGVYDLTSYGAEFKSAQAKLVAQSIVNETGGSADALRARSVLSVARNIRAAALILNGAKDDRTDPEQALRLAGEINGHGGKARIIIYPRYGHRIPVEARASAIDGFIDAVARK